MDPFGLFLVTWLCNWPYVAGIAVLGIAVIAFAFRWSIWGKIAGALVMAAIVAPAIVMTLSVIFEDHFLRSCISFSLR
jgi:hypothetical protein